MTVTTHLHGGLGNQMFQYALGRQLAQSNGTDLILDRSIFSSYDLHAYSLAPFAIRASIGSDEAMRRTYRRARFQRLLPPPLRRIHLVAERSLAFHPEVLQARGELYCRGYWQSEKYFPSVGPHLREEFRVMSPAVGLNADILAEIRSTASVSVHVRRADYVTDPSTGAIHGTCDPDYYRAAMELLVSHDPESRFFVFSDDPEWCSAHLPKEDFHLRFLAHNDAGTNYEDLRLMAACKSHIIANSSFSWWGAWLGEDDQGLTVAPRRWFLDRTRPSADIVPSRWTRL